MIQGKWYAPESDLADVLAIREAVFHRGGDALDRLSWNVLVWQDGIPAATGRIWWQDGAYRLGDLCVLPEYRGKKLGDLVLRLLLFKASGHAAREVRLSCDPELCGFFSRLGFSAETVRDSAAEMVLAGDKIELDSCKSCKKENCPNRKQA